MIDSAAILTRDQRNSWWLYPNLLSLDAPIVAVLWFFVLSEVWNVRYVEPLLSIVLAMTVWCIYAGDRVLDYWLRGEMHSSARHRFHYRYRHLFLIGVAATATISTIAALIYLQYSVLVMAVAPILATVGFFSLSLLAGRHAPVSNTKNLFAAYGFAWGVGAGLVGLMPTMTLWHLLTSREMLCFGLLCWINITAIDRWCGDTDSDAEEMDVMSVSMPVLVLGLASLYFMRSNPEEASHRFYICLLVACALLHALNRWRKSFDKEQLRVLADLVLVAPALLFWLL